MQIRLCIGAWLITKVFPLLCRWTILRCPSTVLVCGCCACAGSIWWWHRAAGSSRRKSSSSGPWGVGERCSLHLRALTQWVCVEEPHGYACTMSILFSCRRTQPTSQRDHLLPGAEGRMLCNLFLLCLFIYHVVCLHYELILVASEKNTPVWWQQLRRNGMDLCMPSLLSLGMSLLRGGRQMYNTRQTNSPQLAVTGFCWGGRWGLWFGNSQTIRECWRVTWLSSYHSAFNPVQLLDVTDDEGSCLNRNLQGTFLHGTSWKSPDPKLTQIQCKVCFNFYIFHHYL